MGDRQLNEENQEENEKLLKETYTEFPAYKGGTAGQGSGLSRFFYKFFAGISGRGRPKKAVDKLSGDVVKSAEVVPDEIATPSLGVSRSYPQLPQIEFERRRKYSEYENIKEYLKEHNSDIERDDYDDEDDYNKAVFEEIQNDTTLIMIDDESFIIGNV